MPFALNGTDFMFRKEYFQVGYLIACVAEARLLSSLIQCLNSVVFLLQRFFMTIHDSTVPIKLRRKTRKFKEYLTKRFQWNFDDEPEEDAPVVVETS